ncbi:hypothetical protein MPH_11288 [Macrophomina phaseolina MS6]|uniref:PRISE-like Rossmann-fold domain-containing protein n=1 Tax=Macrophomina phaseolina (strain MS6) TaxID=1126212 RepID=K2RFX1_MACPH|nr:hypothetical protein MPH_11288 [Macrophomina phaseolina MS6]
MEEKVAFVTGCNGVSGNAIVEHLVRCSKKEWSKIIVTSRSRPPLLWPDPRLEFIPIDFLDPAEGIVELIRSHCRYVTHAFFTSYVHVDNFSELKEKNIPLFKNFLDAITTVSPNLKRHYGCHLGPVEIPVCESLPRCKDNGDNFYYEQEDYLREKQVGSRWYYNVIRPHAIVGYAPHATGMSQALTAAIYLLVCKEDGDPGAFPGSAFIFDHFDDCSYAPSLADLSVWASTQEHCANEDFVHCNGDVYMFRYFWPHLAAYFGVKAPDSTFPKSGNVRKGHASEISMVEWASNKRHIWERICRKYGGKVEAFDWGTWAFFDWSLGKTWVTVASTAKARKFGWTRIDNSYDAWIDTFRSFANAGILPQRPAVLEEE